jgi:hypothetical protein
VLTKESFRNGPIFWGKCPNPCCECEQFLIPGQRVNIGKPCYLCEGCSNFRTLVMCDQPGEWAITIGDSRVLHWDTRERYWSAGKLTIIKKGRHLPSVVFLSICDEKKCGQFSQSDDKFSSCAGCMQQKYCSRECQKRDWPNHKD